jgi:Ca2+-binding EF-hand superfamily protein
VVLDKAAAMVQEYDKDGDKKIGREELVEALPTFK